MKIEPGKLYRTRDGGKAEIYAVNRREPYCIHGVSGSEDEIRCWLPNGRYKLLEDHHTFDIVSEWVEPEPPKPPYYLANKEKANKYNADYYQAHKERIDARTKKYYTDNKATILKRRAIKRKERQDGEG